MTSWRVVPPLLASAFAAGHATPASASCAPATEAQHLARADAVFSGEVLGVRASDGSAMVRILGVRKGDLLRGAVTRVRPEPFRSSVTLDWNPRRGEHWRLYVTRSARRWVTNDCTGTRRVRPPARR